jgi:hypothetical protein
MSKASRKREKPAGSKEMHLARDRFIHDTVDWVMQQAASRA